MTDLERLQEFLARRSGSEAGLGDIARALRVSLREAEGLCNEANRAGWLVFHGSERGVLYTP